MGKEIVPLQLFDDGLHTVVTPHAEIIALRDIVGENNTRVLP